MKMTIALVWLCLVWLCVVPCAAEGGRVRQHTGLRPVSDAKGKWGFIARTGRFVIAPRFDRAHEFSDGVAYVWTWEGSRRSHGIVDTKGRFTPLPEQDYEIVFHDGLARVHASSGRERKYGYIDKAGRMVIQPQFDHAGHFSEGLAWASVLKERQWLYGFIDATGKFVVPPQFTHEPGDFIDGLARVAVEGLYGFIDRAGRHRIPAKFEQLDAFFSEGLVAGVLRGEPPRGVYLNRDGQAVFEIPFWQQRTARQRRLLRLGWQISAPFSEGLAPVLSDNKIGFIDKTGRVVIAPQFRETRGFSEGLAAVKIIGSDGQYVWGYIDLTGKFVIAPQFTEAQTFAGGLASVTTLALGRRLIDARGRVVWQASK